ncbi:MAG: hypothetical protein ACFFF9_15950 [Candidatus Thorarchaeota archaeon]
MIMNKDSGLAPYTHEFYIGSLDPQVISGFISAMSSFLVFVSGEEQSSWKTIYGMDTTVLVETGDWTFGVLAVSRETNEVRSKLLHVMNEFEDCFQVFKNSDGIEGSAFREFDQFVRRLFTDDKVTTRTLVMKRPELERSDLTFNLPSTTFNVLKTLGCIEGVQSIQEIADFLSFHTDDVIDHVSRAYWKNAIYLKPIPTDNDILAPSESALSVLFHKANPLRLSDDSLNMIARFDGRTQLSTLIKDVKIPKVNSLLLDLGELINRGYIQRISEDCQRVLLNECILSNLILRGYQIIGRKTMTCLFDQIKEEGKKNHPWINRINLTSMMQSDCVFDSYSSPVALNDIQDTLEFFIEELKEELSKLCGKDVVEGLLQSIKTKLGENVISK